MYLPLSRKYRPVTFDEIIGQDHITTTLKNAISMNRLSNAYLFTGSRGIGKTSTARVFAKALNCEKGPTIKPCNKCAACAEISKGISLDVLEIDGASNRGIDEIRNIKEYIKLKPVNGKYKIYIIDEVHMLTPEAFNALLKTLEEPPPHVKFIFATTKAHKILPTIISRCQRFDFRMIPVPQTAEILKEIMKKEKLSVEENALLLIAKAANGSLRDAQMILDQLASFTKDKIKEEDIRKMFGSLEQEIFLNISEAILNNNGNALLKIIDELINNGKDPMFIAASLVEHFRNLMVLSISKDENSEAVILNEGEKKDLVALSQKFSAEELFYIVYTLQAAIDRIAMTSLGKIPLEVALLKLSRKEKLIPIDEIMARLESKQNDKIQMTNDKVMSNDKIQNSKEEPKIMAPKTSDLSGNDLFQRLKGVWPEVIRGVKEKKMSIGSYFGEGRLLELNGNKIIIGFLPLNSLHREVLDTEANKSLIKSILKNILEKDFEIGFILCKLEESTEGELSGPERAEEPEIQLPAKKRDPMVQSAVDIFKGRIVKEGYIKKDN